MGFNFKIDGVPVSFKDPKEAAQFMREYAQSEKRPAKNGREASAVGESGFPLAKITRDFLVALRHAGATGIDTKHAMKSLGIKDPKAFGNRGKLINRFLGTLSIDPKDVYSNAKNAEGNREWKAGPKAVEALEAINKQLEKV